MASPTPSWGTVRVHGVWVNQNGTMKAGTYTVEMPVRVTNSGEDVIIPKGVFASGALNTTPGTPSLDVQVPASDDPDNIPNGFQPVLTVTFTDAPAELYLLTVPVALVGDSGGINLRTVVLPDTIPDPEELLVRGAPGGIAGLDADGDVIDAEGDKILGGTGGTGTAWPLLNVKAAPYNAAGDGTTNDTAAIQAALDACPTGGEVYLPTGRYKVTSTLRVKGHSTTIRGAGIGQQAGATQNGIGTRIEVAAGFTGTQVILAETATGPTDAIPVYGATLRDFTIDGNTVGSGITGIELRSNRCFVSHVHVHRCTGNGFSLHGYVSPPDAVNWNTYDSVLAFVQAGNNGAAGVLFDTGSADGHLTSAVLFDNQYNILLKGSSQQITACHTYDATLDNIKFDGGGSRTKIINCKIEGAGQNGINLDSTNGGYSDIQITGNGLNTNGDSADNTYDHIILQGPTANGITRTTIVGNSFGHKSSVSANRARYGVNMNSSSSQGTVVVGNSFGPSPVWQTGSTAQIVTLPVRNGGSTSNPATVRANAGAADDPVPYVPLAETVNVVAVSGATETLPGLQTATIHDVTLTANCTFTFPAPVAGQSFMLLLRQDATGSRTATWPGSVVWPSGTAPTLSTAANRCDLFSFVCVSGTSWRGSQPEKYLS